MASLAHRHRPGASRRALAAVMLATVAGLGPTTAAASEPAAEADEPAALSVESQGIVPVDAQLWDALIGHELALELEDEDLAGRLVGRAGTSLVLARRGDDLIVAISQLRVRKVHVAQDVPARPARPPRTGVGLLVVGGLCTGIGAPFLIGGIVTAVLCPSCIFLTAPFLGVGGGLLGAGIPMLKIGTDRRARWLQVQGAPRRPLDPRVQPALVPGVRLTF